MTASNGLTVADASSDVSVLAGSVPLGGLAPFLIGLVVAVALTWAVWLGIRVRRREPARPRPEEQPRLPEGGPVHEVRERREPDEVPRSDERLTPHQLKGQGTVGSKRSDDQEPDRWSSGSSGAFGSGGPGNQT
ncbi:hypothetical protein GCM10018785_14370 [Streptomyces longispororuber]|uniref:Secreted protein n=1 Tax=Streptomyces longispororuber TaxID=68230 RepID=A0A918ZCM5_9ACTN|nr:DUF6479 family protein [Streptomyces longispororuber]GHE45822.1 hypothetical protein GCM10018785_14370 [Streptomyces longispororuber]